MNFTQMKKWAEWSQIFDLYWENCSLISSMWPSATAEWPLLLRMRCALGTSQPDCSGHLSLRVRVRAKFTHTWPVDFTATESYFSVPSIKSKKRNNLLGDLQFSRKKWGQWRGKETDFLFWKKGCSFIFNRQTNSINIKPISKEALLLYPPLGHLTGDP